MPLTTTGGANDRHPEEAAKRLPYRTRRPFFAGHGGRMIASVKHAGAAALDQLSHLIAQVRARGGLREKQPGVFYRRGKAWLHFHEDKAGLFADLRASADWERFRVSEPDEQAGLLAAIDRAL
jgi:hypothetical protein